MRTVAKYSRCLRKSLRRQGTPEQFRPEKTTLFRHSYQDFGRFLEDFGRGSSRHRGLGRIPEASANPEQRRRGVPVVKGAARCARPSSSRSAPQQSGGFRSGENDTNQHRRFKVARRRPLQGSQPKDRGAKSRADPTEYTLRQSVPFCSQPRISNGSSAEISMSVNFCSLTHEWYGLSNAPSTEIQSKRSIG
jgi:hypothetical protein